MPACRLCTIRVGTAARFPGSCAQETPCNVKEQCSSCCRRNVQEQAGAAGVSGGIAYVFLQSAYAAAGVTSLRGQGFVLSRANGKWSAPAYISVSKLSAGLSMGAALVLRCTVCARGLVCEPRSAANIGRMSRTLVRRGLIEGARCFTVPACTPASRGGGQQAAGRVLLACTSQSSGAVQT